MQERHHVVWLRIVPEHRLGEDTLVVDVDVEDAARSRYELDAADHAVQLLEDSRCQTDSVRPGVSGNAILDPNAVTLSHPH